ncbi:MAG: adenosylmethionine--8-amino-7-oxononanoate transaminase [Methylotenera sp.]|uniref:adenosylmethionine--8-amino-7-oxononanoate transaminase n=1 Tax=Methylotenera sp. TaxID=2051956 RepID=UPI0027225F34|nr:adenosylmethionine--8-amino-7-oxononanoate transaminase [Methylotenera sp.]MDO9394798.1 adenosylmethionine--8-amino-7-oxononanoate transaminase [Methylotenera sp.]MDP1523170.1 adenosylmethionine--8-amino-7-oxononanoate transaminase [Methylotenera sp.]MDP2070093.1 adenosylmethionine--8-amino-7-oxononanoate transaminase [Methylotenera sp.]MDP2229983.1 adenosylmethionine--8-amino-7-oxononanoate transaminase [Methylotenera sp.]MDP3140546.1 adenosylmethionine--8-amino-7-oxononanoate transaminase
MSNQNILNRSMQSVWHPCTQMKQHEQFPLIPIKKGDGAWLYDAEGKRYLDAVSSWWVNLFGHNNPRIKDAIKQQLDTLEHVMLAGFTHEPVIELSEKLSKLTGLGHAFYASDGASATEIALKMSFHYWRNLRSETPGKTNKTKFISLQNSYHGETLGALGVTDVAIFKDTYAPLLTQSAQMPTPDFRLAEAGESAEAFAMRCADALELYVTKHHHELAAFIIEPLVQCAAGMGMYHPAYLRRAREICTQYEVHLIADEIAVGFGRTGTMFACEQGDICPDFICLSKGITGGYLPLSAVLTTDKVYQAFYDENTVRGFLHSHSYTGNPLACSAALATLAIFESDDVLQNNREKSAVIQAEMQVLTNLPIEHMRHQGMIFAFDVVTQSAQFSKQCYQAAMQQGLLLRPIGNTVYFMPPYTISEAEIDFMVNATFDAVKSTV